MHAVRDAIPSVLWHPKVPSRHLLRTIHLPRSVSIRADASVTSLRVRCCISFRGRSMLDKARVCEDARHASSRPVKYPHGALMRLQCRFSYCVKDSMCTNCTFLCNIVVKEADEDAMILVSVGRQDPRGCSGQSLHHAWHGPRPDFNVCRVMISLHREGHANLV
jgi:hypothetical protein